MRQSVLIQHEGNRKPLLAFLQIHSKVTWLSGYYHKADYMAFRLTIIKTTMYLKKNIFKIANQQNFSIFKVFYLRLHSNFYRTHYVNFRAGLHLP